jgi:hypothetical protein
MNTPIQHIPFAELADLAEEKISEQERTAPMAHIAACQKCAGEFDRLKQLITAMRTDASQDAPRDVIAYAVNIFQAHTRLNEPSLLRRIVAALTFDSAKAEPAFGLRSGPATARQLLFAAEDNDLDLRIQSQAEEWVVSGQLLGSTCAGGHVELHGESASVLAELNDLCEFKLAAVPPGNYRLRLRLEDVELEVQQLELGRAD